MNKTVSITLVLVATGFTFHVSHGAEAARTPVATPRKMSPRKIETMTPGESLQGSSAETTTSTALPKSDATGRLTPADMPKNETPATTSTPIAQPRSTELAEGMPTGTTSTGMMSPETMSPETTSTASSTGVNEVKTPLSATAAVTPAAKDAVSESKENSFTGKKSTYGTEKTTTGEQPSAEGPKKTMGQVMSDWWKSFKSMFSFGKPTTSKESTQA